MLWSQRRGPFLAAGFRVRVIHCWWTFESVEQAQELLRAGFGEAGAALSTLMKRPRLEYQVAIYHRAATDSLAQSRTEDATGAPLDAAVAAG